MITMGVQRILREMGCELVDSPEVAEQVLLMLFMEEDGFRMSSPVLLRKFHTIGESTRLWLLIR